jgi:hypothetical protein
MTVHLIDGTLRALPSLLRLAPIQQRQKPPLRRRRRHAADRAPNVLTMMADSLQSHNSNHSGLRSCRHRSLLARMPKPKPRKRLRPRGFFRRWKWVLIPVVVLLLIPAMQVAVVRFINPPWTLPMWIDQGSAMFSSTPKPPLRYRWIDLPQIPEMFMKHLWISEDQRFFQHEGL